jgi:hypothetical protein
MSDADAAQPTEGGGQDGGQQGGGHPSWDVDRYPADLRDFATEVLRDHDGDVTKRFQQHAEYRKQWEPFEKINGLRDVDPEDLQGLLQFHQQISTPEGQQAFMDNMLSQVEEDQWAQIGQENGWLDDEDQGDGYDDEDQGNEGMLSKIQELLDQRLGPVEEWTQQQEQRQAEQEIDQTIDKELADLHEQYGEFDDDTVQALALLYDGEDALQQGLAKFFEIQGDSQQDLIGRKTNQPDLALSGGQADTEPEAFTGLRDPRLKQATMRRFQGQ